MQLNATYGGDAFYLFHRPRRWNDAERVWMGFERKRGKLADLNWLLREANAASVSERFSLVVGNVAALAGTRYVITLDTDTELPRDAARQFVGTMAHPLNRPQFDATLGRVRDGYGILQPRVSPSLPGTNRSRYARLHSGEAGIDPYTRTVSDVYQDLFDEGSFIGKGIYDVDAFEQAIDGKFPENRILSHDLLEGCYARSGLLSDVELFEDYPADLCGRRRAPAPLDPRRLADRKLAAGRACRASADSAYRNPLSALSSWKIADNLRRSLRADRAVAVAAGRAGWRCLPRWRGPSSSLGIVLRAAAAQFPRAAGAEAARSRAAAAPGGGRAVGGDAMRTGGACARVPAARSLVQRRRDPAHHLAHPGVASPAAGMEPVRRAGAQRRARAAGVSAVDVDRAGARRSRRGAYLAVGAAVGAAAGRADPAALAGRTRHHVVAEPSAGPTRAEAQPRTAGIPAHAGPAHVGLLRSIRRTR